MIVKLIFKQILIEFINSTKNNKYAKIFKKMFSVEIIIRSYIFKHPLIIINYLSTTKCSTNPFYKKPIHNNVKYFNN
jgi:hypothetical protein